jgi:hypothetical protein
MRTYSISIFFGLSTAFAVGIPIAAEAATFDYNKLQLIPVKPIETKNSLSFFGDPTNNQGQTVFFNIDPSAPDRGHTEISLNSPGNIAPYYGTGRNGSPEQSGATSAASLIGVDQGFTNFFKYMTDNNISFSNIGIGYGPKSGQDFTDTWNLGEDKLGEDWLASPTSTLEERIYSADPDEVEVFLSYNGQKIVDFGYTPFYAILEYGDTPSIQDDFDVILSEVVPVTKVAGLDSLLNGLANAFLKDVKKGGGGIQAVSEVFAATDPGIIVKNPFIIANLPLPLSLRVGSVKTVPEPSFVLGLLFLGTLGAVSRRKKAI